MKADLQKEQQEREKLARIADAASELHMRAKSRLDPRSRATQYVRAACMFARCGLRYTREALKVTNDTVYNGLVIIGPKIRALVHVRLGETLHDC